MDNYVRVALRDPLKDSLRGLLAGAPIANQSDRAILCDRLDTEAGTLGRNVRYWPTPCFEIVDIFRYSERILRIAIAKVQLRFHLCYLFRVSTGECLSLAQIKG